MEFVFFGNDWSAENRTSSHHISRRLAARFPLLYVESPGLRAPRANARDLRKLVRKLALTLQPPRQAGEHFWVTTLPQIPLRRFRIVRAANRLVSRFLLRRAMKKIGFKQPIAWFHVPHPGFLAGKLGERLTVFYCIDDYSQLPDVDSTSIRTMDDQLTAASDIVFACSQMLVDSHRRINANVHLSLHGVDADLFALASAAETPLPAAAAGMMHPVVGFWGLLDPRVDVSILASIARARPNWTILHVGRVAADVSALKGLSNVVLAGARPYDELPQWAKAIDVCILPYVANSLVMPSSPLKLREFLAAGKPTVTVQLPDVEQFGGLVYLAGSAEQYLAAIEQALAENSPPLEARRRQAVAANTWDAVVERILAALQNQLATR